MIELNRKQSAIGSDSTQLRPSHAPMVNLCHLLQFASSIRFHCSTPLILLSVMSRQKWEAWLQVSATCRRVRASETAV